MSDFPLPTAISRPTRPWKGSCLAGLLSTALLFLAGCGHFRPESSAQYVYVTVKQMYLRDRVAVVANRVAEVKNGERLRVLQTIPRFMQVKTPDGAVGWVEDHAVIDQSEFDDFQNLAKRYADQKPVATATLYNELYMHLAPGRQTQHFYLLPANTRVSLLERASTPKYLSRNVLGLPNATAKSAPPRRNRVQKQTFESRFLPSVPMEDWWLARDSAGHTGWMLSRDLNVSVPEDVAQYAENERMIGAYVLRTVVDPASGKPGGQVPEYLTVLTPYREGLPYDFDQVRVFTWDTRHHRYGTSFRLRDVAGYFPVTVTPGNRSDPNGPEPTFSFKVATGDNASLDPKTGMPRPEQLQTVTYKLEGNLVRKVLPPGSTPASAPARRAVRSRVTHGAVRRRHRR